MRTPDAPAARVGRLADFRFNVTAESQGRLQVARLYELTEDKGVRDMLYLADPQPLGETVTELPAVDPRVHGTPKMPVPPTASD